MAIVDGAKIRAGRDALDLTQAELAELAGVSQQLVSKLENGPDVDPRLAGVLSIARVLDLRVDDLLVQPDVAPLGV